MCVFLYGGNDGNNTVIPIDTAGYAQYAAVRTAASGIQLAQASLLPIQPASIGTPFGLHPSLAELADALQPAQARGARQRRHAGAADDQVAVPRRAGARCRCTRTPTSRRSGRARCPAQLAGTGWGGRIADKVAALNARPGFPVVTSLGGTVLFTTGNVDVAARDSRRRLVRARRLQQQRGEQRAPGRAEAVPRRGVRQPVRRRRERDRRAGARTVGDDEPDPRQRQLHGRADLRAAGRQQRPRRRCSRSRRRSRRARPPARKRQIFFVSLGNFDTHANQAPTQANLLGAAVARAEGVLRRDRRARRRRPGDDVHAVRFRPHVPAGVGRRHRPRVGQPPLHHRRRGARAATSSASIRRSRSAVRTTRSSAAAGFRRRGGPVRRHAREVVRRRAGRSRDGLPEPRPLRVERLGFMA